jgi:hypothetical protein
MPILGARPLAFLLLASLVSAFTALGASPAATVAPEFQVKAVFLFNFTQFVEWPSEAFPEPNMALVIGVLGDDPFGTDLDDAVRGEKVNDRPIVVRRFSRVQDVTTCHILYISRSEAGQLDQILASLKGRSILTVGDMDDFSQLGGMIRFVMERNKVRLRININAVKSARLKISSKLLRPSEIVTRRGQ